MTMFENLQKRAKKGYQKLSLGKEYKKKKITVALVGALSTDHLNDHLHSTSLALSVYRPKCVSLKSNDA